MNYLVKLTEAGAEEGSVEGDSDGIEEGSVDGDREGTEVGSELGESEGDWVGAGAGAGPCDCAVLQRYLLALIPSFSVHFELVVERLGKPSIAKIAVRGVEIMVLNT